MESGRRLSGKRGGPSGRPRARWWLGAGLALVIAVVVVFGVAQGGGSGGGPLNAIAKAAEVTQREPGGRALFRSTTTTPTLPEGLTEAGSMVFDDSGRTRGTLNVSSYETGEKKLRSITDGTTAYVTSDAFESLPDGKKWLAVDLKHATKGSSASASADDSPQEGLKVLEHVQGATEVGKEDIDGVSTTHYRGTLIPSEEIFGVKAHYSTLDVDVWIDPQDRVRRMQLDISGSLGEAGESSTTHMTIDFVEFGRVPKINPPNQDEVLDVTKKVESQIQSAAEGH